LDIKVKLEEKKVAERMGIEEGNKLLDDTYKVLETKILEYRSESDLDIIRKAFELARHGHDGQYRQSGEPYLIHPLEVSIILADIRADKESILAGILHDVVEDTPYTKEDIISRFGEEVSNIVDGVTKIEKVAYVSKTDEQAENYRKMFFHMAQDVRVLLIKIADRLHNMRTLGARPKHKQEAVARETLDIYAPLAHRLGVAKLRYELEELGFKYTDRPFYDDLKQKVEIKQAARQEIVEAIMVEIRAKLKERGVKAEVSGRPKRFYSIYKKMIGQKKQLEEIFDIYAVRVLVDNIGECYEVLGCIHEMYTPVPKRFKDYIGLKKPNGYQSLHTTVIGPGEPFEVQIRTYEMHSVAELGVAAHWKYKEGGKAAKDKWLQQIMDWQREVSNNEEFLDSLKMDLNAFNTSVYCFTPEGAVISLQTGSCPVDFAYTIHSAVGNRMVGAKVNNKMVSVDHILNTGDRVEILTSQNNKGPNRDWLKFVKTTTARSKITQWFNKASREENLRKGREAIEAAAIEVVNIKIDDLLADSRDEDVLNRFNCKNMETLYVMIGVGGLKEKLVINHLYREYERMQPPPSDEELIQNLLEAGKKDDKIKASSGIVIRGIGDTAVRFGKCCGPLPGDEVTGFVTRGRGLTIHRTDCVNILHMDEFERRRLIDAHWQLPEKTRQTYHTDLRLIYDDRDGLLADISKVLSDEKVRVTNLDARTVQSEAVFRVGVEISNGEQLDHLISRLKRETGAHEITRVNL